jgi:hypothetical protein
MLAVSHRLAHQTQNPVGLGRLRLGRLRLRRVLEPSMAAASVLRFSAASSDVASLASSMASRLVIWPWPSCMLVSMAKISPSVGSAEWPVLCTMFLVSAFELEGPFVVGMPPSHGDVRILFSGCPLKSYFRDNRKICFWGLLSKFYFRAVPFVVFHVRDSHRDSHADSRHTPAPRQLSAIIHTAAGYHPRRIFADFSSKPAKLCRSRSQLST